MHCHDYQCLTIVWEILNKKIGTPCKKGTGPNCLNQKLDIKISAFFAVSMVKLKSSQMKPAVDVYDLAGGEIEFAFGNSANGFGDVFGFSPAFERR